MFQYSQSVLDALMAFPKQRFKLVVAHVNPFWDRLLQSYETPVCFVRNGRWGLLLGKWWNASGLPAAVWRRLSVAVDPVSRAVSRAQCDLWIFPAQDIVTYQAPVAALGTIHDLMHRYEPRFPEVSDHGRFHARERRFRNICRWAAGSWSIPRQADSRCTNLTQRRCTRFSLCPTSPHVASSKVALRQASMNGTDCRKSFSSILLNSGGIRTMRGCVVLWRLSEKHADLALVLVGSETTNTGLWPTW